MKAVLVGGDINIAVVEIIVRDVPIAIASVSNGIREA